jgi:2-polyprenyl-6-methoxyphenol hydroxylase-like FAD-dependent oxidoreductase
MDIAIDGKPRALVIGGSLGGLFAATSLRAIGWDVQVFERSPHALSSRGGGVVLQPDVPAAFRFAGLDYPHPLGIPSGDRIFLGADDRVLSRRYLPQTQSSWNMFYGVLARGLPPGVIHAGERLLRFEQDGAKVTAFFASGRVETGDLLVGADGIDSTVRAQLLPGLAPRHAGYVAWRGLVAETALHPAAQDLLRGTFAFQQGDGHLALEYMVPGSDESTAAGARRWNWIWYRKVAQGAALDALMTDTDGRRHAYSLPPGMVKQADIDALRADASAMAAPAFQHLMAATEQPFIQAIVDLEVPRMVFGRAILVGDAAFIPRPHTAGSTAKAAANARTLAQLLQEGGDVDAALQRWEATQWQAGHDMVRSGIATGNRIMGIGGAAG